jgi:hypothetical protein
MRNFQIIICNVLIVFIFFSCSKNETRVNKRFDLSDKVLHTEEVKVVAQKINGIISKTKSGIIPSAKIEREYKNALSILIDNGNVLYKEIINYIDQNDEIQFSDDEINQLLNIEDQHLVELSLIMSFVYSDKLDNEQLIKSIEQKDADRVISCIGVALGINEIAGLVSNTAYSSLIGTKRQFVSTNWMMAYDVLPSTISE